MKKKRIVFTGLLVCMVLQVFLARTRTVNGDAAHYAYACDSAWDTVLLSEEIPIDKIVPSRDGVYFLSDGTLRYWNFQDQTCSVIIVFYRGVLDCELTREGYLAVGYAAANVAFYLGSTDWMVLEVVVVSTTVLTRWILLLQGLTRWLTFSTTARIG